MHPKQKQFYRRTVKFYALTYKHIKNDIHQKKKENKNLLHSTLPPIHSLAHTNNNNRQVE